MFGVDPTPFLGGGVSWPPKNFTLFPSNGKKGLPRVITM